MGIFGQVALAVVAVQLTLLQQGNGGRCRFLGVETNLCGTMGKKKVVVDGQVYANRGIRSREAKEPSKCSDWSASREGDLPEKVDLRPYVSCGNYVNFCEEGVCL
eukprot:763107-Rhodomonas_salina.1